MSQLNVNIIKNEAGTAGPTLSGDVTITGSINTSGIITATTLTIGAGTTALPSISPTGDSNTGIFFPAADTVAISEGGTEALRVDSSGRLLVGTSSNTGANLLQVNSDALVNGITVGRGLASISSNTAVGASALAANTTGINNTAVGNLALDVCTTSSANTAIGVNALGSNTSGGGNNTAVGINALAVFNPPGNAACTALGTSALQACTTGAGNAAIGFGALYSCTTGGANLAIGGNDGVGNYNNTLGSLTTATENIALGAGTLQALTTGNRNLGVGVKALSSCTTGASNIAIGAVGGQIGLPVLNTLTTGGNNIAIGSEALGSLTTTNSNIAIGNAAGIVMTTAQENVVVGANAMTVCTTGANNTAIGYNAGGSSGNANTTGSNNAFIGSGSIGASATASNIFTLGNSSIATLRCQVTTITALSDARDKTNITNLPAGLDFINALRPVAFDWNMRDGGKVGIHEFGFIAQELQEVQASTGITVPNLVSTENPEKLEASAGTLLPVLVNAVQELTAMVRDLQAELSILKGA